MNRYLLDTNICIYYLKGKHGIDKKLEYVGIDNCFISEITVAELKFGTENSANVGKNRKVLHAFINGLKVLPIYDTLDIYAKQKTILRKNGMIVDDFDLLIGATAIAFELTLVTNNSKHFQNLEGITLENWVE